jgi:hypothetical protein
MAPQDRDDSQDQVRNVDNDSPAEFAGPPRPVALTPLARKERRTPASVARPALSLPAPVKIALGVAAGLLLLFAITVLYVRSSQRAAAETAARAARQATEQIERDNQQRAETAQRAFAQRQRLADEQEQARIQRIREQERQADQAQGVVSGEAERRQRAWEAYYRKPPGCIDAATMECTNHYIRARRAFDEKFAKGQL